MNLSFRQLRYAVTAAELGNLSRAALQLHVSQPSISAAIAQIEAEFGQAIFVRRRGSGVALTAFGRSMIDQAQRVLGALRGLEQLGLAAREPFGRLVLGCFDELAPYYAPALSRESLGGQEDVMREVIGNGTPRMPGFKVHFQAADIDAIVAYLKTVPPQGAPAPAPKARGDQRDAD